MPGLRIARCVRPPFIRRVKIGPSWPKVPLDLSLFCTALRLAMTRRYDAVHSHEEGGALGVLIAWLLRVPHSYDMHSSLPQQIANFGYSNRAWLSRLLAGLERQMIRRSRVVIVICPELEDDREGGRPGRPDGAHRKRAGFGRPADAGHGRRGPAGARAGAGRADRHVHRNVRGVPGTRASVRGDVARARPAARREAGARGRRRRAGRGRARPRASSRPRTGGHPCRSAAGRRHSGVPRRRNGARLAAIDRHEHAAQDLPVPPVRPSHCRDEAAHAHAGSVR